MGDYLLIFLLQFNCTDSLQKVGKELRLKQQYFWTAASLNDIIRRFKNLGKPITEFPEREYFTRHSLRVETDLFT